MAFHTRPFVLCGLPLRRPPEHQLTYTRQNGKFFLQITGHPQFGLPFGQDRLIPIWVATLGLRQRCRSLRFRTAAEMLVPEQPEDIEDDHLPFLRLGVPAVDLINFDYGPLNLYWHNRHDTANKCNPASLSVLGAVVLNTLGTLEAVLHPKQRARCLKVRDPANPGGVSHRLGRASRKTSNGTKLLTPVHLVAQHR